MVVQERLMTAEEFAARPNDGKQYELVKGVPVEVCRPNYAHGKLQVKFARFLDTYADEHDLGAVITETGHILSRNPDTVRGPDVAFISKDRAKQQEPTGFVPTAPDLAIEIVSPNDSATEINDKIKEYFRAGSRLVWIVYPDAPEVYAYSGSSTNVQIIGIDGTLDGEDVLPGFTLPLRDVFKGLGEQQGNQP